MNISEVLCVYGTKKAIADALGIHKSAVTKWGNQVPLLRQFQLQQATAGRLVAEKTKAKSAA